jgi:dGTPase
LPDFLHFDGNAQGLRILARLQWNTDEFALNLTYSQLAAFLKYVRPPYKDERRGYFNKKPGFFYTEEGLVKEIWKALKMPSGQRFPLVYIVEAADDIAYCLSDIEDALEKQIITEDFFRTEIDKLWENERIKHKEKNFHQSFMPKIIKDCWKKKRPEASPRNVRFFDFKVAVTRELTEQAAENYLYHHPNILSGEAPPLLDLSPAHKATLKTLKTFAQQHIFKSPEAERLELAGFRIVTGLLEHFQPLLALSHEEFLSVSNFERRYETDLERRLYSMLPPKHILAYEAAVKEAMSIGNGRTRTAQSLAPRTRTFEWFLRAHLITDFISGMTDRYALECYQSLSGIRI